MKIFNSILSSITVPCSLGYAQKFAVAGANLQLALFIQGFAIPNDVNR